MSRPLIALSIASFVLALMFGFQALVDQSFAVPASDDEWASQPSNNAMRVEITLSFDAEPDPFTLDGRTSVMVRSGDREWLARRETVLAGTAIQSELMLVSKENQTASFFLEAYPANRGREAPGAARVRLLEVDRVVAEKLIWSEPGEPLRNELIFDLTSLEGSR